MIKVGDKLPEGTLSEFIEVEGNGCSIGPNGFAVAEAVAGKTIAIFGLPGAYTPTCSAKHLPGCVEMAADLKAAGVDEIGCLSVNDAFVMGAWGRDQHTAGKVRMMLFDAGHRRHRQDTQCRSAGSVRGERRRHDVCASQGGARVVNAP